MTGTRTRWALASTLCVYATTVVVLSSIVAMTAPVRAFAAGASAETEIGVVFVEEPEAFAPDPGGNGAPSDGSGEQHGDAADASQILFPLAPTDDAVVGFATLAGLAGVAAVCSLLSWGKLASANTSKEPVRALGRRAAETTKEARHGR